MMLEVVTAAPDRLLTTLDVVKLKLGIADSASDDLLMMWIGDASAVIESFCNRVFAAETVIETVRSHGARAAILLQRYPHVAISSISENGVLLGSSDYEVDSGTGIILRLSGGYASCTWPAGRIVISYTGGWVLPSQAGANLPRDVRLAADELVKIFWSSKDINPALKSEIIPGVIERQYSAGSGEVDVIHPAIQGLLEPYRLPSI